MTSFRYIIPSLFFGIPLLLILVASTVVAQSTQPHTHIIHPLKLEQVSVNDLFWSPKPGPIVYGLEGIDNPSLDDLTLSAKTPLTLTYKSNLLNGINVITGQAMDKNGKAATFTAIPFYTFRNRGTYPYKVWVAEK